MEKRKKINWENQQLTLDIYRYRNNDRLCILVNGEEEPYCDLTINLPEAYTKGDEVVFISNEAKYSGLEIELVNLGIIEDILGCVNYNMGVYDVAKLNLQKLQEYDEQGFHREFEENEEELEM